MSTETAELTDEAISIFLSEKCGWEYRNDGTAEEPSVYIVIPDENPSATAPKAYERPFTDSLDALFAPGGPVEKCLEDGWGWVLRPAASGKAVLAILSLVQGYDVWSVASPIPARAMAEACALSLGIRDYGNTD